jgi:hypothetical protein
MGFRRGIRSMMCLRSGLVVAHGWEAVNEGEGSMAILRVSCEQERALKRSGVRIHLRRSGPFLRERRRLACAAPRLDSLLREPQSRLHPRRSEHVATERHVGQLFAQFCRQQILSYLLA